jgi:hypothetical protein
MSPMRYELDSYIPEDDNPHSQRRGNLKSYTFLTTSHIIFILI